MKRAFLFLWALLLTVLAVTPAHAGIIFNDTPLPNSWEPEDFDADE